MEKLLLQPLNESTGNILDDGKVIETLETLKKEAAVITKKVEEIDLVMREVEQVTAEYLPLAQACSAIFFILKPELGQSLLPILLAVLPQHLRLRLPSQPELEECF